MGALTWKRWENERAKEVYQIIFLEVRISFPRLCSFLNLRDEKLEKRIPVRGTGMEFCMDQCFASQLDSCRVLRAGGPGGTLGSQAGWAELWTSVNPDYRPTLTCQEGWRGDQKWIPGAARPPLQQ